MRPGRYDDTGYGDTGYGDTGYDDTGYGDTGYNASHRRRPVEVRSEMTLISSHHPGPSRDCGYDQELEHLSMYPHLRNRQTAAAAARRHSM